MSLLVSRGLRNCSSSTDEEEVEDDDDDDDAAEDEDMTLGSSGGKSVKVYCAGFGLENQPKYFDERKSSEVAAKYKYCMERSAWKAAGCDGTATYDIGKSKQRCCLCAAVKYNCHYQRFAKGLRKKEEEKEV